MRDHPLHGFFDGITSLIGRLVLVLALIPLGACLWLDYVNGGIEQAIIATALALPGFIGMFFAWAEHGAIGFIGLGAGGAFALCAWFFCQDIAPVGMFYGAFVASTIVFAPLGGMGARIGQAATAFLVLSFLYWLPAFIAKLRRARD